MADIAGQFAAWIAGFLPGWVRLPNLTFELPHAGYWAGLILFPMIAMYLVRRERARADKPRVSLAVAYMLLVTGGFGGLHRFYLRAGKMAFVLIALFVLVLYGNGQGKQARVGLSDAQNQFKIVDFDIDRYRKQIARGRDSLKPRLEAAEKKLVGLKTKLAAAQSVSDKWAKFSGLFAMIILILLIVDALTLPLLWRRCLKREPPGAEDDFQVIERGPKYDPRQEINTPATRGIGAISTWSGSLVAYWSVIAVFVYYYEVIARYVFNSPTNWAHESMFLMFGMQYLLSGAYAYRDEAHVRVDVLYERLSVRGKARMDVVTSFFFFVFAGTLMITGGIFAYDSAGVLEVSFTEWGIQYWPVKMAIALGAFLILLQGLARLIRDLTYLSRTRAGA